jgi:hypothetical protein
MASGHLMRKEKRPLIVRSLLAKGEGRLEGAFPRDGFGILNVQVRDAAGVGVASPDPLRSDSAGNPHPGTPAARCGAGAAEAGSAAGEGFVRR